MPSACDATWPLSGCRWRQTSTSGRPSPATTADLIEIYNHYVVHTAVTFDLDPIPVAAADGVLRCYSRRRAATGCSSRRERIGSSAMPRVASSGRERRTTVGRGHRLSAPGRGRPGDRLDALPAAVRRPRGRGPPSGVRRRSRCPTRRRWPCIVGSVSSTWARCTRSAASTTSGGTCCAWSDRCRERRSREPRPAPRGRLPRCAAARRRGTPTCGTTRTARPCRTPSRSRSRRCCRPAVSAVRARTR